MYIYLIVFIIIIINIFPFQEYKQTQNHKNEIKTRKINKIMWKVESEESFQ